MKHRIFTAILTLLLLLYAAVPVFAIGENMSASRGTPVVDGQIDVSWKRADRQKLGYITGGEKGKTAASAAYVSVLWDDEALYFLFELIDDDFTFDQPAGSELNDSVYLYIDETGYFGPTSEGYQTVIALSPALGLSCYPLDGPAPRDYEMAFSWDEDGHGIIEFKYVPHSLDLAKEEAVLMDFQFNDASPDGTLACRYNWSDMLGEAREDSSSWTYVKLRRSGNSDTGYATLQDAADAINRTPVSRYTFRSGTEGYGNEGPNNIWDNNVGTKFCTGTFPMESIVRIPGNTMIDGIIMATANDNDPYNGRNPNDWKIEGSLDLDNWELILAGDEEFFGEVNFTYFAVPVEDCGPFRYIRFTNKSAKSGVCQISEVVVCSTDEALKLAELDVNEPPEIDKTTLVNYESRERAAAQAAQTVQTAQTAEDPAVNAGGEEHTAQSAARTQDPVPGIAAAGVLLVAVIVAAVVVRTRKED